MTKSSGESLGNPSDELQQQRNKQTEPSTNTQKQDVTAYDLHQI